MQQKRADGDFAKVIVAGAMAGAIILFLLLCCGCASNGRVNVVDFDSREESQIKAAQYEDGCVYGADRTDEQAEKGERAFSAWAELFDMITKLKARIRVISVEWAAKD